MVLFVMPKSKKVVVVPPPTAARTGGSAVSPGTTTRRCRAGAGERADSANQIPGVSVASLILEQLMEAVGPV